MVMRMIGQREGAGNSTHQEDVEEDAAGWDPGHERHAKPLWLIRLRGQSHVFHMLIRLTEHDAVGPSLGQVSLHRQLRASRQQDAAAAS